MPAAFTNNSKRYTIDVCSFRNAAGLSPDVAP